MNATLEFSLNQFPEPVVRLLLAAAEAAGVSYDTIRRRVKAGLIPTVPGLPERVPADFVQRMVKEGGVA